MSNVLNLSTLENQEDIKDRLSIVEKNINFLTNPYNTQVFGAAWDRGESPIMTRIDSAAGLVANVGVDGELVRNDLDMLPIWGEIKEVTDDYGNRFMRFPRTYFRKVKAPNYRSFQASKTEYPGFYLPWLFWDFINKKPVDYVDIGCHRGSYDGSKLSSVPGVAPKSNQTIVQFRTAAEANNVGGLKGYQQLDIHAVDLIRTLMFIEFGTLDIQSVMAGYTEGYYDVDHTALAAGTDTNSIIITSTQAEEYEVGQTVSISSSGKTRSNLPDIALGRLITSIEDGIPEAGQATISFDGDGVTFAQGDFVQNSPSRTGFKSKIAASSGSLKSSDSGKFPCVWRGIESPFGDQFLFVDGVNITNRQVWVAKDASKYKSNQFAGTDYEKIGYANATSDNIVKEMGFDPNFPFAEFPVAVVADEDKYYCDKYFQASGDRIARFGGTWSSGVAAGLSYWRLDGTSSASDLCYGGRLLKKAL